MKASICSVNNCGRKTAGRGYCLKHYKQWSKHGKVTEDSRSAFNLVVDTGRYYELILTDNKLNEVARAKIDYDDLKKVKKIGRWSLNTAGYVKNTETGKYMHRVIMNAKDDELVDHRKIGEKYKRDNRKKNLRICNDSQNKFNMNLLSSNTSGTKGVDFHEGRQQWRARVQHKGVVTNLGWFKTKEEAVKARDKVAQKLHKEFYNQGI